jgi:uncharacterized protein YprB with RNaseH-like and TPR domain
MKQLNKLGISHQWMQNHQLESFDITSLIKNHQGKSINHLFENQRVIENSMGQFLDIYWQDVDICCNINLSLSKVTLIQNLKTIYYIGKHKELYFKKRGVNTIYDFRYMKRYRYSANELISLIRKKDYRALLKNPYIYDLDTSFCFKLKDFIFIDIETLDVFDSPIIMIGIGFFNPKFEIQILFARTIEEEIAICEHFKNEILPLFKCFITYNGKTFDIPYIANRFLYYYDMNPMISVNDTPYDDTNTIYHHIDLYQNSRRKYKNSCVKFTLTDIERDVLHVNRENTLPSNLVGFCYRKYLENPLTYVGLVKACIEHNFWDIYSMPLLFEKLLTD